LQRFVYPVDDVCGTVFCDHADDYLAEIFERFVPREIFHVLTSFTAMLISVVLDGDLVLLPTHVEYSY